MVWSYLLIATSIAFMAMFFAFVVSLKINFYSLVDVVWSYAFGLIAITFACVDASFDARLVFYAMTLVWSVRLGAHLVVRLRSHFPIEDTRYVELRSKWEGHLTSRFALFFLIQAVTIVILATPLVLVASSPRSEFGILKALSVGLWLLAMSGEALADAQLSRFKRRPQNKGLVCDVGLWRYTRHPNYFCEWLVWCSYALFAIDVSGSMLPLVAPLIMFVLLNFVSGVPLSEAQSLKSKGVLYVAYQKKTSRFFPWF